MGSPGTVANAATTVLAALATLLLGALVGLLGAFQHASTVGLGGVRWPVGLVASLVALALAQLLVRDVLPLGLGPAVVLVSWIVVVATFGTSRPEGDLIVAADGAGQAYLYGGFLIGMAVAIAFAVRSAQRRAGARPAPGTVADTATGTAPTGR